MPRGGPAALYASKPVDHSLRSGPELTKWRSDRPCRAHTRAMEAPSGQSGTSVTCEQLAELAGQLRTVLALVEAGGLPAEMDQVEQLRGGAVAVVDVLRGHPVSESRL